MIEHHHHSFDPFPDDHRTLPFGSGADVFYNYIDLRFYTTDQTFQIRVWITDKHLKGVIYTDKEWPYSYHVFERNHRFIQQGDKVYRANEIWRSVVDCQTGMQLYEEHLIDNFAEVKYPVDLNSLQLVAQSESLICC